MSENHRLIFGSGMADHEFVICLSHLLRSALTEGEWGKMLDDSSTSLLECIKEVKH